MDDDLHKKTLNLRRGDFEYIAGAFATRNVSASYVIRAVISQFVDQLRSSNDTPEITGVTLDD